MFSNNKCFGKENILLQCHVSRLSVNVRMGSEFGKQSRYLWSYMSCLSVAIQVVVYSAGNRVPSVLCMYEEHGWWCVYTKTLLYQEEATVLGGKHCFDSCYSVYCL